MEFLQNIKWYHVTILCLILIIIFFICTGYNDNKTCANAEKFTPEEQKTHELTKDSANGEIILYYALWCGHSRNFLPEWEKFEQYAKANMPHLRVSRMRCEDGDEATCQQKGIEGYPTVVLYFGNGTERIFDGQRKMESLVEFINSNINIKN